MYPIGILSHHSSRLAKGSIPQPGKLPLKRRTSSHRLRYLSGANEPVWPLRNRNDSRQWFRRASPYPFFRPLDTQIHIRPEVSWRRTMISHPKME